MLRVIMEIANQPAFAMSSIGKVVAVVVLYVSYVLQKCYKRLTVECDEPEVHLLTGANDIYAEAYDDVIKLCIRRHKRSLCADD